MDWITGLQRAVDYVEEHLEGELDYGEIARQAACSPFYFQRIFGILCGMSLGGYIRSRQMTLAGSELARTDTRVIDVALKYGYSSPESFTRAFVRFHGITPSEAKKDGSRLKSFSRVSVQIILKGGSVMDYKIVKKEAFTVLERMERQSIDDIQGQNTVPEFWTRCHGDGTVEALLKQTPDRSFIFGICRSHPHTEQKTFDYSIAAVYGGGEVPEGFRVREIPPRTWAVFGVTGAMPDAIQEVWHKICAEFFPTSSYEPTYEMDIEAYPAGEMNSPEYQCEIWVPVQNK